MSGLNCRPGDLAVVVRSAAGNEGRIVSCVRLADHHECARDGMDVLRPHWVIEPPLLSKWGFKSRICADRLLRPLRDSDGQDEMLRIAGLPQEREVA